MGLSLLVSVVSTPLFLSNPSFGEEAHVETLQNLAGRLSQESNRSVEVDRALAGFPIFVDRRAMPVQDVLASVAYSLRASVIRTPEGWRITRTDDDKAAMLRNIQGLWQERLGNWITESDRLAAQVGPKDSLAQIQRYQRAVDEQLAALQKEGRNAAITVHINPSELTPTGAFYRDIVKSIGIDKITAIKPEERRIWSNKPAPGQLPCPRGEELLAKCEREQRSFLALSNSPLSFEPVRFTFQQVGGTSFKLAIYDGLGNVIGRYGGPPFTNNMAGPILISYAHLAQPFGRDASAWKTLDPPANDFERFIGASKALGALSSQSLSEGILRPQLRDPLDYSVRTALQDIAQRIPGKGVVVAASDEFIRIASDCMMDGKLNVRGFHHILAEKCQYESKIHNGVTVFRAQDPYLFERRTVDRNRLGEQTRILLARDAIQTSDIATAYFRNFPSEDSPVLEKIIYAIARFKSASRNNSRYMGGGPLAMIGAGLQARKPGDAATVVDPNLPPFKTLINRGINEGWLRFETTRKVPAAEMDPAALFMSASPRLLIESESIPAAHLIGLQTGTAVPPQEGQYQPVDRVGAILGGFAATLPLMNLPGDENKMPNREEMSKKMGAFGNFHTGFQDLIHVDLYVRPDMRARLSLQQLRLDRANIPYSQLPKGVQAIMLDAAMKAIGEIAKSAAKGGVGDIGNSVKKVDPPLK